MLFFVKKRDLLVSQWHLLTAPDPKPEPEERRRKTRGFLSGVASHAGNRSGPSIGARSPLSWRQAL